jgi:hypothetical protein
MTLDVMANYLSKRDYRIIKEIIKTRLSYPPQFTSNEKLSDGDYERLNEILFSMNDGKKVR